MSDNDGYDDGCTLIAGVLYDDETGAEAEPVRSGSVLVSCGACGDVAETEVGSLCGRDLSEERGLPVGSVVCCGVYSVRG